MKLSGLNVLISALASAVHPQISLVNSASRPNKSLACCGLTYLAAVDRAAWLDVAIWLFHQWLVVKGVEVEGSTEFFG